jgi:hypothetical protein
MDQEIKKQIIAGIVGLIIGGTIQFFYYRWRDT